MATPLFSIVIPTFNRSDLVPYAIGSVLGQTFDDFEIIVSDNSSTDDTAEVVRGFTDPRVRYVRTPKRLVVSESWEFARSSARGTLILLLGDDDALLATTLQRFAHEHRRHDADFLFCKLAEYRDGGFPGRDKNTLTSPPFSGASRRITIDEFVQPMFSFRLRFNLHPSGFFFSRALADRVASRCGRFFQTNGVEYCSWPLAAALAKNIIYIDTPLAICGRTGKSWGSNLRLANPGKERIETIIASFEEPYRCAPLSNFTMSNHWAEGLLTAQKLLPEEFAGYKLDEIAYLRATMRELKRRRALGVDVTRETNELAEYLQKSHAPAQEIVTLEATSAKGVWSSLRTRLGDLGLRSFRLHLRQYQNARKVKQGDVASGFGVAGADFSFYNIGQCAQFLTRVIPAAPSEA
jgi:glycosyltransferase involved in cell wall biosynthesis